MLLPLIQFKNNVLISAQSHGPHTHTHKHTRLAHTHVCAHMIHRMCVYLLYKWAIANNAGSTPQTWAHSPKAHTSVDVAIRCGAVLGAHRFVDAQAIRFWCWLPIPGRLMFNQSVCVGGGGWLFARLVVVSLCDGSVWRRVTAAAAASDVVDGCACTFHVCWVKCQNNGH